MLILSHLSKATARLNGLDLGLGERLATEAGGELVTVKVEALNRLDGAESTAGSATNAGKLRADGLAEGTVLLGVLAVGAEGGGRTPVGRKGVGGRGRVRLGGVVDGSYINKEADCQQRHETLRFASQDDQMRHTGMLGGAGRGGNIPGMVLRPRNLMEGTRSA